MVAEPRLGHAQLAQLLVREQRLGQRLAPRQPDLDEAGGGILTDSPSLLVPILHLLKDGDIYENDGIALVRFRPGSSRGRAA